MDIGAGHLQLEIVELSFDFVAHHCVSFQRHSGKILNHKIPNPSTKELIVLLNEADYFALLHGATRKPICGTFNVNASFYCNLHIF